jgi:hypothetical protein
MLLRSFLIGYGWCVSIICCRLVLVLLLAEFAFEREWQGTRVVVQSEANVRSDEPQGASQLFIEVKRL